MSNNLSVIVLLLHLCLSAADTASVLRHDLWRSRERKIPLWRQGLKERVIRAENLMLTGLFGRKKHLKMTEQKCSSGGGDCDVADVSATTTFYTPKGSSETGLSSVEKPTKQCIIVIKKTTSACKKTNES